MYHVVGCISLTTDLLEFYHQTIPWMALFCAKKKMACWCPRSEENGHWFEFDLNSNHHLLQPNYGGKHLWMHHTTNSVADGRQGCHSFQPTTEHWGDNLHKLTKIEQWRNEWRNVAWSDESDFSFVIGNIMKAWIHPALYQQFRQLVVMSLWGGVAQSIDLKLCSWTWQMSLL